MISEIGSKIRFIRQKKGIGLNTYAEKLGVSPAYLSNLETGKTDTIQLSLLEKLQEDLKLLPIEESVELAGLDDNQLIEVIRRLKQLHTDDPKKARHLLAIIEEAFELIL